MRNHEKTEGKLFHFAGTLRYISQKMANHLVSVAGGKVSPHVSAYVNYLVVGECAPNAAFLYCNLAIPLSEDEFLEMMGIEVNDLSDFGLRCFENFPISYKRKCKNPVVEDLFVRLPFSAS